MSTKRACILGYLHSGSLFQYQEIAARCNASESYVQKIATELMQLERQGVSKSLLTQRTVQQTPIVAVPVQDGYHSEASDSSVYLHDLIDVDLLQHNIESGFISVRHNDGLSIHNYTSAAAYGRHWDSTTLLCRGLITDADNRIIARPFKSFLGRTNLALRRFLILAKWT